MKFISFHKPKFLFSTNSRPYSIFFIFLDEGLAWLSKAWRMCKPLSKATDVDDLKDWLVDVYTNLGMTDYPYPTSFLMPLPANPIIVRDLFKLKKKLYISIKLTFS